MLVVVLGDGWRRNGVSFQVGGDVITARRDVVRASIVVMQIIIEENFPFFTDINFSCNSRSVSVAIYLQVLGIGKIV